MGYQRRVHGDFKLKQTHKKMKVLVLLACLSACCAQYLRTTSRNLGSSHNAPSVQNLGGSSRITISGKSNHGSSFSSGNSEFSNGGSAYSSGSNSGHSRFGGNSGYSSGGNDVHHVSSIRHGNTGGGFGLSSGSSGHGRIHSQASGSGRFRSYN